MRSMFSVLVVAVPAIALSWVAALAQVGSSQNQQLMLDTRPSPDTRNPAGELNTLNELFAVIRACWNPPSYDNARAGMRMTMRFSLNRDGGMIGPPMVTFSTPEVSSQTREIYRRAMLQSLKGCTPFRLTSGLGGAIAGRPIVVWVVDQRKAARELRV
jgi:hypothetical protein